MIVRLNNERLGVDKSSVFGHNDSLMIKKYEPLSEKSTALHAKITDSLR